MTIVDRFLKAYFPIRALRREEARYHMQAYEAARTSRLHQAKQDHRTADRAIEQAGRSIRGQARWMEENEDLIDSLLSVMVNHIVGPNGIAVEPQPLTYGGDVHEGMAKQLLTLYSEWSLKPETTGTLTRPEAERLICRSWLRDGEVLAEMIYGRAPGFFHPNGNIPLSFNLLEADFLDLQYNDESRNIVQSIERNSWDQPLAYHLHRTHPGSCLLTGYKQDRRRVAAARILHPKQVKRLHQGRGISVLASAIKRIGGINNYEESELVAARISAAMAFFIKKADPQSYQSYVENGSDVRRDRSYMSIKPGTIFDDLEPGEEVGTIESKRPNGYVQSFLDNMVRRVCSAVGANYSTVAKKYDGTYSSQRQELVESYIAYQIYQNGFIAQWTRPVYRHFVRAAIDSGRLVIPADVDPKTIFNAWYQPPVMPWIDPAKEAEGFTGIVKSGFATEAEIIRSRGRNPQETKRQRSREIEENRRLDLVFDSDATHEYYGEKNAKKRADDAVGDVDEPAQ